jgi:hypothetical protein
MDVFYYYPLKRSIMKVKSNTFIILLAVVFLFFVSCASEELEGPTGVKLTLKARTMLKSASDTVKINEALIGVSKIDFKPEGSELNSVSEKIVYNGPYVVDLLNGNTSPEIKWVFVDPGVYREVKISTSGGLRGGHSLIVRGTIKPAGVTKEVPFEFSTKNEQDILVKSNRGIVVKQGDITELMIVFELAGLFNEFDLSSVERNSDGVLMLTDETGSGIVAGLKKRLENISSFGLLDSNFSETQVETAGPGNDGETGGNAGSGGGSGNNDGNAPGSDSGQDGGGTGGTTDPGSGSGNDDDSSSGNDSDPGQGSSDGTDNQDDDGNQDQGGEPDTGGGSDDNDDDSGDSSGSDGGSSDGGSGNDSGNNDDDDDDDDDNKDDDDDDRNDDDKDDDDDRNDDGKQGDDDDKDDDDKKDDKDNSGKGNSGNAPGNSGNGPGNSGNGNKGGNPGKGK